MGEGGVSGLQGPTGRQNLSQATWVSAGGVQGDSNNSFQPLGLVFQQWVRYFEIPAVLEGWPVFSVVGSLAQKPLFLGQTWPSRRPSLSDCLARFKSLQWPAAGSKTGMWPSCHHHRQSWGYRQAPTSSSPPSPGWENPGAPAEECLGLAGSLLLPWGGQI